MGIIKISPKNLKTNESKLNQLKNDQQTSTGDTQEQQD